MFTGMTGYRSYIASAGVVLGAVAFICQHLAAGDLSQVWPQAVALFSGGAGIAALRAAIK